MWQSNLSVFTASLQLRRIAKFYSTASVQVIQKVVFMRPSGSLLFLILMFVGVFASVRPIAACMMICTLLYRKLFSCSFVFGRGKKAPDSAASVDVTRSMCQVSGGVLTACVCAHC